MTLSYWKDDGFSSGYFDPPEPKRMSNWQTNLNILEKMRGWKGYLEVGGYSNDEFIEMYDWLEENCKGRYKVKSVSHQVDHILFYNKDDAMLFKLVCGGDNGN